MLESGGCRATPMLLGQETPRVRSQFLLTSITAMSTTTSARALSRSLISFWASSSSSGVPRMTMAFWLARHRFGAGEHVAQSGLHVIHVVRLPGVAQVEGLDGLHVQFAALDAGVLGDEEGIGGNGAPEGTGHGAHDAQGIKQGDVV